MGFNKAPTAGRGVGCGEHLHVKGNEVLGWLLEPISTFTEGWH